jgi:hypothetical protein
MNPDDDGGGVLFADIGTVEDRALCLLTTAEKGRLESDPVQAWAHELIQAAARIRQYAVFADDALRAVLDAWSSAESRAHRTKPSVPAMPRCYRRVRDAEPGGCLDALLNETAKQGTNTQGGE